MADQVMGGVTELNALRPEIWSEAFYPTLLQALPFNDLIARNYEGEIRALGDRVNITTFPQFGLADTIPENGRADADAVTATKTVLNINQQIVKDFIITDRAMVQTIDSANALRDLAFFSIMRKMQQIIIAEVAPSTSAPDNTLGYTSGTTLALADILAAKEQLDTSDVPDDGQRAMVLGAAQWNDIFNITGFTSRDFTNTQPLLNGSLPAQVLGFSPRLTTEAGATAFFFHRIFQQMAVQKGLTVEVFNLGVDGKRAMRVNSTLLMGTKQVSNLRVVTVS